MHVAYLLKKFPRASETFIQNEILALQRHGVDVTVFSLNRPDDGVFHRGLADLQRPVVYVPVRKSDAWLGHLRQHRELLHEKSVALATELDDLLLAGRPDVWAVLGNALDVALLARQHGVQHLHAHFATVAAYTARTAAALSGFSFSVTCHAKDIYRTGIAPAAFQSLLQPAAFVVTVCEANRRWIGTELAGDAHINLRVLYNGVDTQAFHPRHRAPAATPMLLAVGRLVEKKGFHVLLDALAIMARDGQRPRCLLVGDGEERQRLVAQRERLGLDHVEFVGMRPQDQVRELMQQASLLVQPCIVGQDGNRDALPTVLLEAMATGLPVLSTAIGGVEEIVDDGKAGVLVPAGEAPPLAAAMTHLLHDPARLRELATAGRARAETLFDLATNTGTLRDLFAAALESSRGLEVAR